MVNEVVSNSSGATLRLESLYLDDGFDVNDGALAARSLSLSLSGDPRSADQMRGTLVLDPNVCTLNAFGDRRACTLIALQSIDVTLTRQALIDPEGLNRRFFSVSGEGLPQDLAFIVQDDFERAYLKLDRQLVPLYVNGGV